MATVGDLIDFLERCSKASISKDSFKRIERLVENVLSEQLVHLKRRLKQLPRSTELGLRTEEELAWLEQTIFK